MARKAKESIAAKHLVRHDSWAGLVRGDAVAIAEVKLRGARWEFVAHVTNTTNGEEWVEVVGGRPGDRKIRSFAPGQVFPVTSGKGRPALSFEDAPRLPL